jgi:cell division septum initiation protein DivIVA
MYEKAVSTGSIPAAARGNLRAKRMLDEDKRLANARAAADAEVQRLTIALSNAQQAVVAAQKQQADTIAQAAEKARQRQAEEAERQRQAAAAEQKRLADIAAEQARIAAEQEKVRQARQAAVNKLKSSGIQSVRGLPTTAAPAASPLTWSVASAGGI